MSIRFGARAITAGLFGAAFLATTHGASASPGSGCIQNGEIVTFDGVASVRARVPDASESAWVLNLPRPICVLRSAPFAPIVTREKIYAIRIIGTPPPLGVPLALTGKLLLGRPDSGATMFVALEVIRGRKVATADSVAPPPAVGSPRVAPLPPAVPRPTQMAAPRCEAPPYGGKRADYETFVRRFGHIIRPDKILAGICNAKFGRAPRDGLHKLGLTDAMIDSENTEHLAAETIVALKTLVNTIE